MMRRKRILEQVMHGMELSSEVSPKESLVEMISGKRVLIEHHNGIRQYNCERILVKLMNGELCIIGKKLSVSLMTKDRLIIKGVIESIHTGNIIGGEKR